MSRTAPRDERLAKRCNNTCPICWMPLNVEATGVQADKWKDAQVTFKAKPAFSVRENGTDYSRTVLVFGLHPFVGLKENNYEGSHFVHYSMVGNHQKFNAMWDVTNAGVNHRHSTRCIVDEPGKFGAFFDRLFSSGGVFKEAFASGSETDSLLQELTRDDGAIRSLLGRSATLKHIILDDVFMGCVDCNSKMTISEFIDPLFALVFPHDTYKPSESNKAKRKKKRDVPLTPREAGFDSETMMHYIMLSGNLKAGCRVGNPSMETEGSEIQSVEFNVPIEADRYTWFIKYVMIWCALQIQFCSWKMASLYTGIRHHSFYVYRGVIDFYLSLWLYALYFVTTEGRRTDVNFDEFRYYYVSIVPFSTPHAAPVNGMYNLSSIVFNKYGIGEEKFPVDSRDPLDDVQKLMRDMFDDVHIFWKTTMKDICLGIHGLNGKSLPPYFIPYNSIETRRGVVTSTAFRLTVQSFCDLLSPYWYWFHFKHITMPVIAKTSNEYRLHSRLPPAAQTLWFQWCRSFGERVRVLGVRLHMEQRALQIRLRFKMDLP